VQLFHGDLRAASDLENPAGRRLGDRRRGQPERARRRRRQDSSRQLVEHNLAGTVNLLEYCKGHHAGLILLSTSRVYSIAPLAALPVEPWGGRVPAGPQAKAFFRSYGCRGR